MAGALPGMVGMRLRWVATFLLAWLAAGTAKAAERRLLVAFEDSARTLPQPEIREAIAGELSGTVAVEAGGSEAKTPAVPAERLAVALDAEGLWIKYQGPRGMVERHLPLPERGEQIAVVVSLTVGNLVREEAFELQRELERRRAAEAQARQRPPSTAELHRRRVFAAEPTSTAAQPGRRARLNSLGYVFSTVALYFEEVQNPCTARSNRPDVECDDNGRRYRATLPDNRSFSSGSPELMLSGLRWAVAYTRELGPHAAFSVRAGMALGGGGTIPYFAEYRQLLRFGPTWGGGAIRPFEYAGLGVARIEARQRISVPVYGDPADETALPAGYRQVTAVRAYGWFFASLGGGVSARLTKSLRAELDLSMLLTFPDFAPTLQGGLGMHYDF
jgi:hypothetical protein